MNTGPLSSNPEERIFTIDDIARLFIRLRPLLFKTVLSGALLTFAFLLVQKPTYLIQATFKEGVEKSSGDGGLKNFLSGLAGATQQPQAIALMKSSQVLRPLVEQRGLQAHIRHSGRISTFLRGIQGNFSAEMGKVLPEIEGFSFEQVRYEGERPVSYRLSFLDKRHFSVLSASGMKLAEGEVGLPVHIGDTTFTCTQIANPIFLKKRYVLTLSPWIDSVRQLRKKIKIISHKANSSIYDLTLEWGNRHQGALILNQLMDEYRAFLKRDFDHLAAEQIAYLEQRQGQIYKKLEMTFDDHASYLKEMIGDKGFCGLREEIDGLLRPHQEMKTKLLGIELELERLEDKDHACFAENKTSQFLAGLVHQIQDLQQQRDMLELTVQATAPGEGLEKHFGELSHLRAQREETEKLYETIQTAGKWALPPSLSWMQGSLQRADFADYLANHMRLLTVREKILQERVTHFSGNSREFDGVDLDTARRLFLEYVGKLDHTEETLRHYTHLKGEIQKDDFELGSLSTVLTDPISQGVVARASALSMQLKDENHHSSKESERWTQEISLQRKMLAEHVEQLCKVEELNTGLLREKIGALQQVSLDCINRQISILDEQVRKSIEQRKENLKSEKDLLQKKMEELRSLASDFPERWKLETWLKLKADMGVKIMKVMTELVETKTIGQHLHHVESKPLDLAAVPFLAKKPFLFLFSVLGGCVAACVLFFLALIRTILKGFPTFSSKLSAMRYPFSGIISAFCDGPAVETLNGPDLQTLRQLSLFLDENPQEKIVSLIGGRGPDYSYALAQNLARAGRQVLLIRSDFSAKFQESDRPGLLQWLQAAGGDIPLRRGEGFDFIPTGGFSPFGMEALQSSRFKTLLAQSRGAYDFVLVWLRAPLDVAETKALLSFSEKAVITVAGEQIEELTPFIDWAYDKKRLTFISCE